MTRQIKKKLAFIAFMGTVLGVLLSCRFYDDRIEIEKGGERRLYSFNQQTIIKSLNDGNTDIFTKLTPLTDDEISHIVVTTPEYSSSLLATSASWGEDDYFRIAQTLHEQSWGKPLGDQNLYNMSFVVSCSDIKQGVFTGARFESFEVVQSGQEEETRIEHWITISPLKNLVSATDVVYQPNVHWKEPIDLSNYQITAEEALKIAEENGGYKKRMDVDNACKVSVLAPGPDSKGWRVIYINEPDMIKGLFEVAVDPQTGEYKVLFPEE